MNDKSQEDLQRLAAARMFLTCLATYVHLMERLGVPRKLLQWVA